MADGAGQAVSVGLAKQVVRVGRRPRGAVRRAARRQRVVSDRAGRRQRADQRDDCGRWGDTGDVQASGVAVRNYHPRRIDDGVASELIPMAASNLDKNHESFR